MGNRGIEFKVGLTVIISIVLLLILILWMQGYRFQQSNITVQAYFPDVAGLKKGDPVSVSGVMKGKVKDFFLENGKVLATMKIEKDANIYSDATFTVRNHGMMGERLIDVYPGTSRTPIDTNQIYMGKSDASTAELAGLLGQTIKDVQQILANFQRTFASEQNLNNLTDLVTSMTRIADKLDRFLDTSEPKLSRSLANLENFSANLATLVDTSHQKIDTALNNFAQASVKLNRLTDSLEAISGILSRFLAKIDQGQGTLGLLGNDETLYQDVKRMVQSVDTIIEDIRRNPKKYLKVEVKIF